MRRHRGWLSGMLVLVISAGAWAQGVGGDLGKQQEDPVKAAIERFTKEYAAGQKAKDESMRTTALDIFNGLCGEQKVVDVIGKVLNTGSETVMVKTKAAMLLGQSGNMKVAGVLEKAFKANEKNDSAYEIVRQLGGIQDKSTVKILEGIIRPRINRFDDERACQIARSGIDAMGRLRFVEAVESLVKLFEPVNSGRPAPDATVPPEDQPKESQRSQSEGTLIAALSSLTGEQHQKFEDWKGWWSKNKKTFKFQ
ncbi:MAG: hypothetical protein HY720_12005 [Planctomycetes bacterium]|nr:hypothetical protein [Planctomycetota bacterium]